MGEIFSGAQAVLMWLGNDDRNVESFIRFVAQPADCPPRLKVQEEEWVHKIHVETRRLSEGESASLWKACETLCYLSYWVRAWIVQECCLGKTKSLIYGAAECTWDSLNSFIHVAIDPGRYQYPGTLLKHRISSSPAWGILGPLRGPSHVFSLSRVVLGYTGLQCTDFHDHIYALLSLARDRSRYVIDYSCSRLELLLHVLIRGLDNYINPIAHYEQMGSLPSGCYSNLLDMQRGNFGDRLQALLQAEAGDANLATTGTLLIPPPKLADFQVFVVKGPIVRNCVTCQSAKKFLLQPVLLNAIETSVGTRPSTYKQNKPPYFSERFLTMESVIAKLQQNDQFLYDDSRGIWFVSRESQADQRCSRVIARVRRECDFRETDKGTTRSTERQDVDSILWEFYGESGLSNVDVLPEAEYDGLQHYHQMSKHRDRLSWRPYGELLSYSPHRGDQTSQLDIQSTYTATILYGLPEDQKLRQACFAVFAQRDESCKNLLQVEFFSEIVPYNFDDDVGLHA